MSALPQPSWFDSIQTTLQKSKTAKTLQWPLLEIFVKTYQKYLIDVRQVLTYYHVDRIRGQLLLIQSMASALAYSEVIDKEDVILSDLSDRGPANTNKDDIISEQHYNQLMSFIERTLCRRFCVLPPEIQKGFAISLCMVSGMSEMGLMKMGI